MVHKAFSLPPRRFYTLYIMTETSRQQLERIYALFPDLSDLQRHQFELLDALYQDWNSKINVISRKDIENLYSHHVLHSLAIARVIRFRSGTRVLDVGTGGGFPGIPLAILFPETTFVLIDSIGKKIRVADAVVQALELKNVTAFHRNAKEEKGKYDFVVSRAVMDMGELMPLVQKNIVPKTPNSLPGGVIVLKGGDLKAELHPFKNRCDIWNISDFFADEYFESKKVAYVAR